MYRYFVLSIAALTTVALLVSATDTFAGHLSTPPGSPAPVAAVSAPAD